MLFDADYVSIPGEKHAVSTALSVSSCIIPSFCFENKTILAFSMFPPPPNLYKQVGFAHFEMHTSPTHTLIMCRNKDAHTP